MIEQGGGCIVNLSSMGAFLNRGANAYSLAKRAIVDITMAAATDYGPHGVRVNAIAPGVIMTDMTAPMRALPGVMEFYEKMTPLGRLGEPQDIANAALLLASDAARFITGKTLLVDGGLIPVDLRNLPAPDGFDSFADWVAAMRRKTRKAGN